MFGRFLPHNESFFDYFQEHARITQEAVAVFVSLGKPGADIPALAAQIKNLEHQADAVTHRCIAALHQTFITPFDRDDIYRLISRMDDIVDNVEATAERIVLYNVSTILPEMCEIAAVLEKCTAQVAKGVAALRQVTDTAPIFEICIAINGLENEADALLRRALARLFRDEKDALMVIKWKEIFEYLESATDRCEDVAQIIEGVVLEHA